MPAAPFSFANRAFRFLRSLLVAYLLVVVLMGTFQDRLIYMPTRAAEPALIDLARTEGLAPWRDGSGAILGWKSDGSKPTANRLLVLHGNGGMALHRAHFVRGFEALGAGKLWQVYLMEYPGYGARSGAPGKESITAALRHAWELLHAEDPRPLYVLGESIGSGPACVTTGFAPPPAGLCFITPYYDLRTVAAHHFPWLPVKLLMRNQWNNTAALADFHGPVAVVLAGEDDVIPIAEGQRLYDSACSPKRLWTIAGAGHNTIDYTLGAPLWRELSEFLLAR
jgi:alpha-beta hydrolase superfamily lysophospholipase